MSQDPGDYMGNGWPAAAPPADAPPISEAVLVASPGQARRRGWRLWRKRPAAIGPQWFEKMSLLGTVGDRQLATFCRQFAAYLDAGVNLLRALESLRRQFAWTKLAPVLDRLMMGVRRGDALADTMAREPGVFDRLFLSMMRVAEIRGGVPETLRALSEHYEARNRMMRQARSALVYPVLVMLIAFGAVLLLTIYVLPLLMGILEDLIMTKHIPMPPPARVLMNFSHFVQDIGWWLLPAAFFGSIFLLWLAYRTRRGKSALDELILLVPVMGPMARRIDLTRFARTLSALLAAGIDIGASLDLTAGVMSLSPLRRAVRRAREGVMEGVPLSNSLAASRRFPNEIVSIVATGEETGRLPEILIPLADDYDQQIEYGIKDLASLFQPLITLVLGGIVFFVMVAFVSVYTTILTNLGEPGG